MYALTLLGIVLVTAQATALTPIPVRVHFITEQNQKLDGDTTTEYLAALCGGCAFQGLKAFFGVSLVNRDWSYDTGYYITVTVKDTDGNVIANNLDVSGIPVPDFNFTYVAKYKNLFFEVVTGPAATFVFTLSLTFDYTDRVYPLSECTHRWQMTTLENTMWRKYREGNNTALLQPVFKTAITQSIETEEFKLYRLDYCFGDNLTYKIAVSVITEDQKSGFVSYGCKKTYMIAHGRCDVRTPFRDISGGPVNLVVMDLEKPADYGPVHVLISGDGRHHQNNHFTLAASVPY